MPIENKDYGLVVGINDYPDFKDLSGAVKDAEAFTEWLKDRVTGGGLEYDHVTTILSTPNPPTPVQDQVDDALRVLFTSAKETGGRRFYFYFSGHGVGEDVDDVALCLAKWSRDWYRYLALSSSEYRKFMQACGMFPEIVFLLDCCRNRIAGTGGMRPQAGLPKPGAAAGQSKAFVGYATEFQSTAYEAEVDAPGSKRGIFTKALLTGLRGAAAKNGGGVTAVDLKKYLETETPRLANDANVSQKAVVLNELPSDPPPIFGHAAAKANIVIEFKPTRTGTIELEGPDLSIVKSGPVESGPWTLLLKRGLYILRDRQTGQEQNLRFKRDQEETRVRF